MNGTWRTTVFLTAAFMLVLPLAPFAFSETHVYAGPEDRPCLINVPPGELPLLVTRWGTSSMVELFDSLPVSKRDRDTDNWMVQFDGPIERSWGEELERSGFPILGYLPEFTYIVRLGGQDPHSLMSFDHVAAAGPFPSVLKMDPDTYERLEGSGRLVDKLGEEMVLVDTFIKVTGIEKELKRISPMVDAGSDTRFIIGPTISSRDDLLAIDGISHIEPYYSMELHNEIAKDIISVQEVWDTLGLDGTGQIVTIADTGLDTGIDDHDVDGDIHLDFDNRATIVNWAGTAPDDGHSHGTHVTGSVAGNGTMSNGTIKGMAPNASIFFQAIMADSGALAIPSNTSELFQQAYDNGSRIHTNSWGANYAGAYTSRSQDVDWFLFNHPEMIILYSAGNNGVDWAPEDGRVDEDNIGAPASAKNCITVGAGENDRSTGGYQLTWSAWNGWRYTPSGWSYESKYPQDPIASDYLSDDPDGLAGFSSRGPTDDGRIKPDVFAPGTNILSCRSSISGAGTGWGVHDSYYVYMGGTSMSTPITAGATVLVREFYNTTLGLESPSGALLKATLINGAMDTTPGQYGSPNLTVQEIQGRPDNHQGWGRINLSESLSPDGGNLAFIDDKEGIWTGAEVVSYLTVSSSAKDLRLTLAYSDAPGATYAAKELVNDLDLIVTAPNGSKYNGNDFSFPFDNLNDRTNPVEGISISSPATGTWKIVISGYNVPMGPQHFAVVASGVISNFSGAVTLDRMYYSTDGDPVGIRVVDQDLIGQGTVTVSIRSTTDMTGSTITLNEIGGDSGLFEGVAWTRNSSTGNSSSMQVSDNDTLTVFYQDNDPSGTFNGTAKAKDPVLVHLWYRPEFGLVQSEGERIHLEGLIDENVSAWWTLEDLPIGWKRFHDDGNTTFGDIAAYDLNVSSVWFVPENMTGNHTLITIVEDPFLGTRSYENFVLSFNGSMPRFPKNLSVSPLPAGNSVRVSWSLSNETDLSYYNVYGNDSSSIAIAPEGWSLLDSTSSVTDHIDITGLQDGVEYSFRASVVDVNGNESSLSVPFNATPVDIIPPNVILTTTPRTIVGTITFTFTGSPDLEIVQMEFYNDSNDNGLLDDGDWEPIGSGPPSGVFWDTTYSSGGPGDINSMWIRYRGLDEVPNPSGWVIASDFRIDNTGPVSVEILSPPPTITRIDSHLLTGKAEALGHVEIWMNDQLSSDPTCNGLGGFTFYMNLTEGVNIVVLRAYDQYGAGPTNRTYRFTLDTQDPVASLDIEDQNNITRNISPDPYWFNSTSYDVGMDQNFTFIENLTWRITDPIGMTELFYGHVDLPYRFMDLGTYIIELTVRDPARNNNMTKVGIEVVDLTPPVIGILGDLMINERDTATFDVNVSDNDELWLHRMADPVRWEFRGPNIMVNITALTARISFPVPGNFTVKLIVTDGGNNSVNITESIRVMDITPPDGSILGPDDVVLGVPATFKANLTDNDAAFPAGASFRWNLSYQEGAPSNYWNLSFNGPTLVYNFTQGGYYMLTLYCSDASGNEREVQRPFSTIGDLTPPTIIRVLPGPNASFQFPEDLKVTITFSEGVNASTLTSQNIMFLDSEGEKLNISLVRKGNSEVQVIPAGLEFGATYSLEVTRDIRDLWNNRLVEGLSHNYTIRTLFSLDFPDGVFPNGTDVNFTGTDEDIYNISLRFTNPVQISSVINALKVDSIKYENVNGYDREVRSKVSFFVVNAGEDNMTVIVSIPLDMGTKYNITLDTSVRDIYDYQLDRDYQWEFLTYLPPSDEPTDPGTDDSTEIPDWLLDPILWVVAVVILLILLLIIILLLRAGRKKNLDKIWEAGTDGGPKRRVSTEYPVQEEETGTVSLDEMDLGPIDEVAPPPPSYDDLYGDLYGGPVTSTEPAWTPPAGGSRPDGKGGIVWDEDLSKVSSDEEEEWNADEEEDEEDWDEDDDDVEGWED